MPKYTKKVSRSLGGDMVMFAILALLSLVMILPIGYAVSNSIKPPGEFFTFPPKFFVQNPTLMNYRDLFSVLTNSTIPFSKYLYNTLVVSAIGTVGHVFIASLCAYALAKHDFYGSKIIFNVVVFSLMFSTAVTSVPNFLIMSKLKIINSLNSLVLPAFASSLGLFLMKQFMETMVPDAMLEAARIDGASEIRIFGQIVMPMVRPAWLTLIVFSFQSLWNSSGGIFIQTEGKKTLNYAISQIVAGGTARAGAGAASMVLMMILPILVFIITQSNIVETMAASGIKE